MDQHNPKRGGMADKSLLTTNYKKLPVNVFQIDPIRPYIWQISIKKKVAIPKPFASLLSEHSSPGLRRKPVANLF